MLIDQKKVFELIEKSKILIEEQKIDSFDTVGITISKDVIGTLNIFGTKDEKSFKYEIEL